MSQLHTLLVILIDRWTLHLAVIFIFKGKHKAVLINYPDQFQKELLIKGK